MKDNKAYRINGFDQIKSFYSWVFNNAQKRVTPQHISLYLFLINQNNRNNWVEWFKCPLDLGMAGACIGNKKTYYSCLMDLAEWELIKYEKGINEYKAPLIKIEVLKSTSDDTAEVPQSEPLPIPQDTPLPIPLPTHIYKLITDNLKPITKHYDALEKFVLSLGQKTEEKTWRTDFEAYKSECFKIYQSLLIDPKFISEQEKFHPGVDIALTLEKAYVNYWGTEAGWKKKKSGRSNEIDWKRTFTTAIDINKVYKPKSFDQTKPNKEHIPDYLTNRL